MYEWVEKAKETMSDLVLMPNGRIVKEVKDDTEKLYQEYLTEVWTIVSF